MGHTFLQTSLRPYSYLDTRQWKRIFCPHTGYGFGRCAVEHKKVINTCQQVSKVDMGQKQGNTINQSKHEH